MAKDMVNHPPHYAEHPSGVECIEITEHMGFCDGNAFKYVFRAGSKGDMLEDLKKALWYVERVLHTERVCRYRVTRGGEQALRTLLEWNQRYGSDRKATVLAGVFYGRYAAAHRVLFEWIKELEAQPVSDEEQAARA